MVDLADFEYPEEWQLAVAFFEFGDPSRLGELVRIGSPVPTFLRPWFAEVVEGKRKPPKQGKARARFTPAHDRELRQALEPWTHPFGFLNKKPRDPELEQYCNQRLTVVVQRIAEDAGLKTSTVNQRIKALKGEALRRERANQKALEEWRKRVRLRLLAAKNNPFSGTPE